jgi:hypothetical protein
MSTRTPAGAYVLAALLPLGEPSGNAARLTATLVDHTAIALSWEDPASEAGGAFVEFRMAGDEEFTLLNAVWRGTTALRHPDVAPETTYNYRVRNFFGRPSDVAEIVTGAAPPEGAPQPEEGPFEATPPLARPAVQRSLKTTATIAEARPAALTAILSAASSPTSVDLRWTDRASDEDGYLAEMAVGPDAEFELIALLPPNATSFRKVGLAAQTRHRFRVRAHFLGPPSNVAGVTTPPEKGGH